MPEALSTEVGAEVGRPESPRPYLVLQGAQQDLDLLALRLPVDLVGPQQIERLDLLLDELPYPLQLSFELSIGFKVPAHRAAFFQGLTRDVLRTCSTRPGLRLGP